MPSGGRRTGAGRKPLALADKLARGNPGGRPLKKNKTKIDGNRPKPPEYLKLTAKPADPYPSAVEFFEEIVDWLEPTGCLSLVPVGNIANYAAAKYFLVESIHSLTQTAVVAKDGSDTYNVTGFAKGFFECLKATNAAWDLIWQVVRDNSETLVKDPEQDFMRSLSAQRKRKRTKGAAKNESDDHNENSGGQTETGEV